MTLQMDVLGKPTYLLILVGGIISHGIMEIYFGIFQTIEKTRIYLQQVPQLWFASIFQLLNRLSPCLKMV